MRLRNIPRADDTLQAHFTVIKNPKEFRGNWTSVFGNDRPIRIEIGMGKGRFLLNMAKTYPNINFIGIERYSSVLLRAVEKFDTEEFSDLPNIRFVCMDARELPEVFAESEVDRIYLNFSDPWPKDRHAKRRLTSEGFLNLYHTILNPDGYIQFKTDNRDLFDFSVETAENSPIWNIKELTYDLHHSEFLQGNIMTEYESKFVAEGKPICRFVLSR